MMPRFRPAAGDVMLPASPMMFAPVPLPFVKLVPPTKCELLPLVSFRPLTLCHWMPNSAALSPDSSTTSDSIMTWAGRTSRRSMIERMLRYSGSGAEMISELVAGSAWIIPAMAPPAPPLDDEEPELEAALLVCEVWPEGLCELAPLALPSEELIGVVVRPLPVACC